jgi:hypothetical protein
MQYRSIQEMKPGETGSQPSDAPVPGDNTGSGIAVCSAADAKLRKPYKPPEVTEYGNVARLTAGGNGSRMDKGHDMAIKNGFG